MLTFMENLVGPSTELWVQRLTDKPGPVLTWYRGGRIEMTGPVLARWLAKVDNYLGSEFAFGESLYHLSLPECWQKAVWEAALLLRGWESADMAEADLVITDDPELLAEAAGLGAAVLAQPTDPLGLRWNAELPAGVTDAPGALLSQSDFSEYSLDVGPLWAAETNLLPGLPTPPGRVFLQRPDARTLLQLWGADGSALIIDRWEEDQERTKNLLEQEQVAHVLAP